MFSLGSSNKLDDTTRMATAAHISREGEESTIGIE
jgi:hypothetical protein